MKTLIIIILIFILSGPVFACDDEERSRLRYNPLADEWSYADPQDRLRYNPLADEWTYEDPDSTLKYNPFEDRFEYAR